MAEIADNIKAILDKFIDESKKAQIKIDQLILFGSYAKGTQTKDSDIDIAVVSENFTGNRFLDNRKLAKARINTNFDIETHPFKTKDFTHDNPFVEEIENTGIRYI
jgi:predicted nucleotidyltransferase